MTYSVMESSADTLHGVSKAIWTPVQLLLMRTVMGTLADSKKRISVSRHGRSVLAEMLRA